MKSTPTLKTLTSDLIRSEMYWILSYWGTIVESNGEKVWADKYNDLEEELIKRGEDK